MTTLNQLKSVITNQEELEVIAKHIWVMNFERLIRLGFNMDFATQTATELSEKHLRLLQNA